MGKFVFITFCFICVFFLGGYCIRRNYSPIQAARFGGLFSLFVSLVILIILSIYNFFSEPNGINFGWYEYIFFLVLFPAATAFKCNVDVEKYYEAKNDKKIK